MRYDDYNRAENACRIGLALALVAVLLNTFSLYLIPGHDYLDAFGVACGVLSMTASYFSDSLFDDGYSVLEQIALAWLSIVLCAASYVVWLLSFLF